MGILYQIIFITAVFVSVDGAYQLYENVNMMYKLYTAKTTWYKATRTCRSENSRLAMPTNADEAEVLKDILNGLYANNAIAKPTILVIDHAESNHHLLLGFHGKFVEGEYITETDLSIQNFYHQWANRSQSEKKIHKGCGAMNMAGDLIEISCTDHASFVCQRPYATESSQLHIFGQSLSKCSDCTTGLLYGWNNGFIDALWARGNIDETNSQVSICNRNVTLTVRYKENRTSRPDIKLNNGYRYISNMKNLYKLHLNVKTWFEARAICEAENAHLVVLDEKNELIALKKLIQEPEYSLANIEYKNKTFIGHHTLFVASVTHTIYGDLANHKIYDDKNMWIANATARPLTHACDAIISTWIGGFPCNTKGTFICEKASPL